MQNQYHLVQYSFDDGEGFYYVLDSPENVEFLNQIKEKDNGSRFCMLDKKYSSELVDKVVLESGLNDLNCNSSFHKCDSIDDMKQSHLNLR